eukprot:79478_1
MGEIFTQEKQSTPNEKSTTPTKIISTTQTTRKTQPAETKTATKTNLPETDIQIDKVNPINLYYIGDEKAEQDLVDTVTHYQAQLLQKHFQAITTLKEQKVIWGTCDNNHELKFMTKDYLSNKNMIYASGYNCDVCKKINPTFMVYHCSQCLYNLCDDCYKAKSGSNNENLPHQQSSHNPKQAILQKLQTDISKPTINNKWTCVMCTGKNESDCDYCKICDGPSPVKNDLWDKRVCRVCMSINSNNAIHCKNCDETLIGFIDYNNNGQLLLIENNGKHTFADNVIEKQLNKVMKAYVLNNIRRHNDCKWHESTDCNGVIDNLIRLRADKVEAMNKNEITCEHMQNIHSDNPLHCPIYYSMKEEKEYNSENLEHLDAFTHFKDPFSDRSPCKYDKKCKSFINLETGGNDIHDKCHMKLYRHPPRTMHIKLSENMHDFIFNKSRHDSH